MLLPTIGILEHDPTLRRLLTDLLTEANYAVAIYPYPIPAALDHLTPAPALLVLDYYHGDDQLVDQLIRTGRQRGPSWVPVLFCCIEAATVSARWGGEPAVAVCAKPFDVERLLALVAHLLAEPGGASAREAGARPASSGICSGADPTGGSGALVPPTRARAPGRSVDRCTRRVVHRYIYPGTRRKATDNPPNLRISRRAGHPLAGMAGRGTGVAAGRAAREGTGQGRRAMPADLTAASGKERRMREYQRGARAGAAGWAAAAAAQAVADRYQDELEALERAIGAAALALEEATAHAATAQRQMQEAAYQLGRSEDRRGGVAQAADSAAQQAEVAHQQAAATRRGSRRRDRAVP